MSDQTTMHECADCGIFFPAEDEQQPVCEQCGADGRKVFPASIGAPPDESAALTVRNFRQTEAGIYYGLPEDIYHAHEAISSTDLKDLLQSVAHYLDPDTRNTGPAAVLGDMVHALVLEPDRFARQYHQLPDFKEDRKAYYRAKDEAEMQGKEGVSTDFWETAHRVRDKVLEHPTAGKLFNRSKPNAGAEVTALAPVDYRNLPSEAATLDIWTKMRADFVVPGDYIVDLKTTRNGNPDKFSRDAANLGYHISAAWYLNVWNRTCELLDLPYAISDFVTVAAETYPPHNVAVYVWDEAALELGEDQANEAVWRWVDYLLTPPGARESGYGDELQMLSLPGWYYRKNQPL